MSDDQTGNNLDPNQVISEIGADALERLRRLRDHVYPVDVRPRDGNGIAFRYAPSLIARTEAEMLGLSMPRFAARAYFGDGSFVNARRINTFAVATPASWDFPDTPPFDYPPDPNCTNPRDVIKTKASCIADSLLKWHPSGNEDFHVLTVDLGRAYGECESIVGTPFVNHIPFSGGGLCAQATAFMAMAIRHNDPCTVGHGGRHPTVYGLAEATALLRGDGHDPLELSGLTDVKLCQLFESVFPGGNYVLQSAPVWRQEHLAPITTTFRAYLAAGVPVVLTVDMVHLAGQRAGGTGFHARPTESGSIYARNGLHEEIGRVRATLKERPGAKLLHAVLLVGCDRRPGSDGFLINDPSTFPFLDVTAADIQAANNVTSNKIRPRNFIAVPPPAIRLPVFPWGDHTRRYAGLADMAWLVQHRTLGDQIRHDLSLRKTGPQPADGCGLGRLWLLKLSDLLGPTDRLAARPDPVPPALHAVLRRIANQLLAEGTADGHWFWVQYLNPNERPDFPESLWVWDAEQSPPEHEIAPPDGRRDLKCEFRYGTGPHKAAAENYVVALAYPKRESWVVKYPSPAPTNRDDPCPMPSVQGLPALPADAVTLRPAMITSVSVKGASHILRHWPDGVAAELYAFMHQDQCLASPNFINFISPVNHANLNDWNALPVASRLSRLEYYHSTGRGNTPAVVARAVHQLTLAPDGRTIRTPLAAIATFLPELTARDDRFTRRDGIRALTFLVRVARELQALGHPAAVVELVAGSRIERVWPFDRDRGPTPPREGHDVRGYVAERLSPGDAIQRLVDSLRDAVGAAGMNDPAHADRRVSLAVELEPGPLYIVKDERTLHDLVRLLADDKSLSPHVGLSLDIAHFRLAGMGPGWLCDDANARVAERVIHCHLSDHGRGHFGDAVPGELGLGNPSLSDQQRLDTFLPWIRALRHIIQPARRAKDLPPVSGYVSLELEMCKDLPTIQRACTVLKSLLDASPK